jgi:hypothetical protein
MLPHVEIIIYVLKSRLKTLATIAPCLHCVNQLCEISNFHGDEDSSLGLLQASRPCLVYGVTMKLLEWFYCTT